MTGTLCTDILIPLCKCELLPFHIEHEKGLSEFTTICSCSLTGSNQSRSAFHHILFCNISLNQSVSISEIQSSIQVFCKKKKMWSSFARAKLSVTSAWSNLYPSYVWLTHNEDAWVAKVAYFLVHETVEVLRFHQWSRNYFLWVRNIEGSIYKVHSLSTIGLTLFISTVLVWIIFTLSSSFSLT